MNYRIFPLAAALAAFSVQYGSAAAAQGSEAPANILARNVRILAVAPKNVGALIAAGKAALTLGDAHAAAGFFGRANEADPRNLSALSGLGATLVALGNASAALSQFERARQLGATAASIGCDRGLAYDLLGNQSAAQADYRSALAGPDRDEARRRLALSLAIAGDQPAAMRALEPLLAQRDRAAARARALVLALGGDVAAGRAALDQDLPGAGAIAEPYLRKLSGLDPGQKAGAVNLGVFPGDVGPGDPGYPGQALARIDQEVTDPATQEWQGPVPRPMEYGGPANAPASSTMKQGAPDTLALYGVFRTR